MQTIGPEVMLRFNVPEVMLRFTVLMDFILILIPNLNVSVVVL